jgi:multicomponent Na+:H+ antiporter subunit G
MSATDLLVTLLLAAGLFFQVVAATGFVRFPDVFCRLHVTCLTDTLAGPLVLLAAAVWLGPSLVAGKILLAVVFLYFTSPLLGHLLSRAALQSGLRPRSTAADAPQVSKVAVPQARQERHERKSDELVPR